MSVLNDMINEREEWANRHRMTAGRYLQVRAMMEYTVLIVMGLMVYFYYDRMLGFLKSLLGSLL